MGLGLAITKNIIEQFGGTISFETDETGTVFFVDLPALKSEKK
jgi:signal transduction histidine kinase